MPKTLYKMNSLEDHDDDTPVASRAASASKTDASSSEGKRLSAAHQHDHKNLYKTVDLKPGFTHELLIRNSDPKSVLTWDFDVLRNDLHFTLYRITEDLPEKHGELVNHLFGKCNQISRIFFRCGSFLFRSAGLQ